MAKELQDLRAQLGIETGILLTGDATGGAVGNIIDTNGLAHLEEDDTLNGALALIRTTGDSAAPMGESRRVVGYNAAIQAATVEYNFTAAVGVGDVYEFYRVPLTLEDINETINQAIREAWPMIWNPELVEWNSAGEDFHDVGAESAGEPDDIVDIWLQDTNVGTGWQWMPRSMWRYVRDTQVIYFERALSNSVEVRALNKLIYAELGVGADTSLDEGYLMAAAKANLYETLAATLGGSHDISRYLDLMSYWGKKADERKQAVALALERVPPILRGKK